jgi:transcriptional regulator with XRE-family HTH domain
MSSDAAAELAATLYRLRLERGLSLRALAPRLGFSSHSALVDYEKGQRIPPEDLLRAYEKFFAQTTGSLQELRSSALTQSAERKASAWLARLKN